MDLTVQSNSLSDVEAMTTFRIQVTSDVVRIQCNDLNGAPNFDDHQDDTSNCQTIWKTTDGTSNMMSVRHHTSFPLDGDSFHIFLQQFCT
jgi:hypothetical protein